MGGSSDPTCRDVADRGLGGKLRPFFEEREHDLLIVSGNARLDTYSKRVRVLGAFVGSFVSAKLR